MVTKLFVMTVDSTVDLLGGGVCIYIRNAINFSIQHDLFNDQLENLCISIKKYELKPFLV